MLERLDCDPWIEKSSWPNNLFNHQRRARRVDIEFLQGLVGAGNRRDEFPHVLGGGRAEARPSGQNKRHRFVLSNPLSFVGKVVLVSDHAILNFKLRRRRTYVNELVGRLHELVEIERTIIERAGQTKSIIDEHGLTRPITFVHSANLWDGGMRFIDHDQKILWKEIDDRVRL